jgi:hypothetical protein
MVLSAAIRDELTITVEDLATAVQMVTDLEAGMPAVFSKIGRTDVSLQTDRFLNFVRSKRKVPYAEAYRFIHAYFPSMRDFTDVVAGCVNAGYVQLLQEGNAMMLVSLQPPDATPQEG